MELGAGAALAEGFIDCDMLRRHRDALGHPAARQTAARHTAARHSAARHTKAMNPSPHHRPAKTTSLRRRDSTWGRRGSRPSLLSLATVCWALMALSTTPGQATVYVAMPDSDLADGAPLIVLGQIVEVSPWGDGGRPQTRYTLAVDEVLKGSWHQPDIRIDLPGGRGSNGMLWQVAGTPGWNVGDRVLAFLAPTASGGWTLQQFFLGGFSVTSEEGVWIAHRDLSAGHGIQLPGLPSPLDGPRDLEAFSQWLRDRSQGLLRLPDYFLDFATASHHGGAVEPTPSANNAKAGTPIKFSTLRSSSAPWPLGCGDTGDHSLRWFDFEAGGSVLWRSHFNGQPGLDGRGVEELQRGLLAWESSVETLVHWSYGGITTADGGLRSNDGVNALLFEDPYDEIGGRWQGSGVLALGGPWFDCTLRPRRGELFHPIREADIVTQNGLASFFQSLPSPSAAAEELFAHELGHTLGLAHSTASSSLMAPHLHNDGRGASLSVDDLNALFYLYGIDGDSSPPARPKALQAELLSGLRVQLRWLDFSTDEAGFRVERQLQGQAFQALASTPPDVTEWIDESALPGQVYGYRIRAHNSGGPSSTSNRVWVELPTGVGPLAPTAMRAAPLDDQRLRLTWQDNAEDETNYLVEILPPNSDIWVRAPFLVVPDTTALNLSGLESGREYGVRVRARSDSGLSAPSNAARVTTLESSAPCRVESENLCLLHGRFQVEVEFVDAATGQWQAARSIPSTDHTGFFWFFQPGNFELVVKMVDGLDVNRRFWLYFGGITDVEFRLHVTDTSSGETRTYQNAAGQLCGRADTAAFPLEDGLAALPAAPRWQRDGDDFGVTGPAGASFDPLSAQYLGVQYLDVQYLDASALASSPGASRPARHHSTATEGPEEGPATAGNKRSVKASYGLPCHQDDATLCLLDGRLEVSVQYSNPHVNGREGFGHAVRGTEQSGQFWFFRLDSSELVVKAIDGSEENGNIWLFFGSLTDVAFWLHVTDTLTGDTKVYYNPPGQLCGQVDLEAFSGVLSGVSP